ncbi:MAG: DNA polymerase III subunit delta' [Beijerinckiaceae bacterium]|nr:DNA polymerase III subunit delta' [Beijerinckiaceae bacterium]
MAEDLSIELDRFGTSRHPREGEVLFGHQREEAQFLNAYQSGRMPHAWLISGPDGIGKASFAYRAARFILSHPDPKAEAVQGAIALDSRFDPGVGRRISAKSHGDLLTICREIEPGKKTIPTEIKVDQIRKMIQFFETTAGEGGWRIAIIDTMDELNRSGANALLKLIEEPPPRSLFFMITSAPGRLLPTIRSRCRVLSLRPLKEAEIVEALRAQPSPPSQAVALQAARHSGGSVKTALKLMDPATLSIIEHVEQVLQRLPALDRAELLQMADGLVGRERSNDYQTVIETVQNWLAEQCRLRAGEGGHRLAPLAEVWEKSARMADETDRYNLDRRPFLLSLFADLSEAVRLSNGIS